MRQAWLGLALLSLTACNRERPLPVGIPLRVGLHVAPASLDPHERNEFVTFHLPVVRVLERNLIWGIGRGVAFEPRADGRVMLRELRREPELTAPASRGMRRSGP